MVYANAGTDYGQSDQKLATIFDEQFDGSVKESKVPISYAGCDLFTLLVCPITA